MEVSPTSSPGIAVAHLSSLIRALTSPSPPQLLEITTFLAEPILHSPPSSRLHRPPLDELDFLGRLLLTAPLETTGGPAFEVFCLLLKAGCNPFAVARDGVLVEWMLDKVGGMEGRWGVEIARAKAAWRATMAGEQNVAYTLPPEVVNKVHTIVAAEERRNLERAGRVAPRVRASDLFATVKDESSDAPAPPPAVPQAPPAPSAQTRPPPPFVSRLPPQGSRLPAPRHSVPMPSTARTTHSPSFEPPSQRPRLSLTPDLRPPTPTLPPPGISTDPRRRPSGSTATLSAPSASLRFVSLPAWITPVAFTYWLTYGPDSFAACEDPDSVLAYPQVFPEGQPAVGARPPAPVSVEVHEDKDRKKFAMARYSSMEEGVEARKLFYSKRVADKVPEVKAVGVLFL